MATFDDYLKAQRDLLNGVMKPYRDVTRLLDEATRPYRELTSALDISRAAREALRPSHWQEDLIRQMRPALADINTSSRLAAAIRTPPALEMLEQQRRLLAEISMPPSMQAAIDAVNSLDIRPLRYTREIGDLLEVLRPYAEVPPEAPDEETSRTIRADVELIVSSNREDISGPVARLLRWLAENGRRIGWNRVSFILFTLIYPLLLTAYQDEVKAVFHSKPTSAQRETEREVVKAATSRVPAAALTNVRYVGRPTLNVRAASRRNSSAISVLHFGDVVLVVRETKDWTLIEYDMDDDVQIRGWVFTRGLKRFRIPRSR